MKKKRILLVIGVLILVGVACGLTGNTGDSDSSPSDVNGSSNPTNTPTSSQALPTNTGTPEEETSTELPPLSFEEFLEKGVESGRWTQEEGLVTLFKYFVGEVPESEIPGVSEVANKDGSGISFMAQEYLNNPDADSEIRAELELALRKMFPPDDVLEAISEPSSITGLSGGKVAAPRPLPQTQQGVSTCDTLYEEGFIPEDLGITCYNIEEYEIEGHNLHVYFPTQWGSNAEEYDDQNLLLFAVIDALEISIEYYNVIPSLIVPDFSVVFSLIPDSDSPNLPGSIQQPSPDDTTCKLTMFPGAQELEPDNRISQLVAKQVFLCVQYWSFSVGDYGINAWWLQGNAEFFSNQVYPFINREFRNLAYFDERSPYTPIDEMVGAENWVFFQYLGNNYGEDGLLNLIRNISNQNGDIHVLTNETFMEDYFNEFVVKYLSEGILDTNGIDRIKSGQPVAVADTLVITEEGTGSFTAKPFTAVRILVEYEKEKRFLQTPGEGWNVDGRFSSVEYPESQYIENWSDLPPEIRSSCEENVKYLFVPTTTQSSDYTYTVEVTDVQQASCDPCLLGTWAVDNDTFENYAMALMEAENIDPMQGIEQYGAFSFNISGEYLIQFKEDGKMEAARDGYTISVGAGGFDADTIITSHGAGTYSADGETLSIFNLTDTISSLKVVTGGLTFEQEDAAGVPSYSIFQQSYSPELTDERAKSVAGGSEHYLCDADILAIDMPQYGALQFYRVDKILPTPVPSQSSTGN